MNSRTSRASLQRAPTIEDNMVRDPRADILESNPFAGSQPRIHRVHANEPSATRHPMEGFFQAMSQTKPKLHKGGIWHFSDVEKQHLLYATGAFTLALGFMSAGGLAGMREGFSPWLIQVLIAMPIMLIAVGPAFVLHEIGHKIVAKKNGCWAEFRADPKGLQFGMFLAFFLGILFMAPGAVMVAGLVTRRQNGHIAIAGPLVNLGLFVIGIPLGALIIIATGIEGYVWTDPFIVNGALDWQAVVYKGIVYWIGANLLLGAFNMIPFGPLDGLKVKDWNSTIWWALFLVFLGPIIITLTTANNPMTLVYWLAGLV